jgi:hypothetical protein
VTPLSAERRETFLGEHIPYRLHAIDLCAEVATLMGRVGADPPMTIRVGELVTIDARQARAFTSAVLEHGFMSCRAMLECLGIGLRDGGLADRKAQHDDTLTLRHFGLPLVTADEAIAHLDHDPVRIDGLVRTIHAAHHGGAHLTTREERLEAGPLVAGCRATRALVDRFLYGALGRPAPAPLFRPL